MKKQRKAKLVPYKDIPQGKTSTLFGEIKLPSGAVVRVGYQPKREDGPGFLTEFFNPRPDGTTTHLRFALTVDAAMAVAFLYTNALRAKQTKRGTS